MSYAREAIEQLIEKRTAAISAKDADGALAALSDRTITYDLAPPLSVIGTDPKG